MEEYPDFHGDAPLYHSKIEPIIYYNLPLIKSFEVFCNFFPDIKPMNDEILPKVELYYNY